MAIDQELLLKAAKVYEAGEAVEGMQPKEVYESHKKCTPGEFGMNKEGFVSEDAARGLARAQGATSGQIAGIGYGGLGGGLLGALYGAYNPGAKATLDKEGNPVLKRRSRIIGALRGGLGGAALGAGVGNFAGSHIGAHLGERAVSHKAAEDTRSWSDWADDTNDDRTVLGFRKTPARMRHDAEILRQRAQQGPAYVSAVDKNRNPAMYKVLNTPPKPKPQEPTASTPGMFDNIKFSPGTGAGVGALGGAALGALSSKKHTVRNALLGAALGGGGGYLLGHLLKGKTASALDFGASLRVRLES